MGDLSKLNDYEKFLVLALDCATNEEIAEIRFEEIVGLTGEFSPKDVIEGFAPYPERIADVLEKCVGTKRTIGRKTKPATAIDCLIDALTADPKSGEVASNPEELFHVVTSYDLVNHQDAKRIWSLLFRHKWMEERTEKRTRLAGLLLAGVIELRLLTPQEIVELIGTDQFMGDNMPAALRKRALDLALKLGRANDGEGKSKKAIAFDDQQLLVAVKADDLVQNIDLPIIDRVFAAAAKKFKWVEPLVPPPTEEVKADDGEADKLTNPPPAPAENLDPDVEVTVGEATPSTAPPPGDDEGQNADPSAVADAVTKDPGSVDRMLDGIQRQGEPGLDYEVDAPTRIVGSAEMAKMREDSKVGPLPKPGDSKVGPLPKADPDKSPPGGSRLRGPVSNLAGPPPLPGGRKSR